MPYYNKFDIVEAHYWFSVHHHEGQTSDKYLRMCKLLQKPFCYQPAWTMNGPQSENAQAIYEALCLKEGCDHKPITDTVHT